ncbi:hypothetical protein chiPu_0010328 [Chiloscyllium punctatum]|uniref:Uncharacterized protein n=1 Tax=Chiloscyllium punctatum TaxID=137246 RepID=A0A401SNA9_CHIPU|nr:hypothetical protein [Chiloscyllium punctatum]
MQLYENELLSFLSKSLPKNPSAGCLLSQEGDIVRPSGLPKIAESTVPGLSEIAEYSPTNPDSSLRLSHDCRVHGMPEIAEAEPASAENRRSAKKVESAGD